MVVRVVVSWYLGVKPARTTLSDEAMHSIISAVFHAWSVGGFFWGGRRGGRVLAAAEVGMDVVGFEKHRFAD